MKKGWLLVFDTETTGLTLHPDAEARKQPRMIEFGAALVSRDDGSLGTTHNVLINPGHALPAEIVKITGITDEDLKDAPKFADAWPGIKMMFTQANMMAAHNLPFDRAIVWGELVRADLTETGIFPEHKICTVGIYKDDWGRNPKMTELYQHVMGEPLAQTHRALDDVMALVEIIQKEKLWAL